MLSVNENKNFSGNSNYSNKKLHLNGKEVESVYEAKFLGVIRKDKIYTKKNY